MSEDASSSVQPENGMDALRNPPELVQLFDADGESYWVEPHNALKAQVEQGLRAIRYDVDDALATLVAKLKAALDAIPTAMTEMQANRYMRDEDEMIITSALSDVRDAGNTLIFSIGGTLPTEAYLAGLAEHLLVNGQPGDDQPRLQALFAKMGPLLEAFPQDRIAYYQARRKADEEEMEKQLQEVQP